MYRNERTQRTSFTPHSLKMFNKYHKYTIHIYSLNYRLTNMKYVDASHCLLRNAVQTFRDYNSLICNTLSLFM